MKNSTGIKLPEYDKDWFEVDLSKVPYIKIKPPLIMSLEVAGKALDIIEEAIAETEQELGYS